jgi:hypothetical protein
MLNKTVLSSAQEGPSSSESVKSCWTCCRSSFIFCLILGATIISLLLYYRPWQIQALHTKQIDTLKNVTATLTDRINHLESSEKTSQAPFNPEQIQSLESHITTLQQQVEALQTQLKLDEPSGQLQKSQALEKDLNHLAEMQKIIKATLVFWRLKSKVLSDAPYALELIAYKSISSPDEALSILEKYADQGLQALQTPSEEQTFSSSESKATSWTERFKAAASSLIKIEKVDTPIAQPDPTNQDRQAVVELLARIDQTLAQKLDMPLSGDVLK